MPLAWVAVLAAPFATHAALTTGRFTVAATALACAQVLLLGAVAVRTMRGLHRVAALVAVAILFGLLLVRLAWPGWAGEAGLVAASGFSHAFIYGSLLLVFSNSLQPRKTDLVTGLAMRLRGSLTPEMLRYTRHVTEAWCVFFALQLLTSVLLLALAPRAAWSLFTNVLDGPCVVAMFAGEYAVRHCRFRNYRHISPFETARSFARDRAAR